MDSPTLIQLKNTNYYTLTNKHTKHALFLDHESKNLQKQRVCLRELNEEVLGQIWMIVEIAPQRYPNQYEIVHTLSTLVLTAEKEWMEIRTGKWRGSQLFFLQKWNAKMFPNEYWIKEQKDSHRYLTAQSSTKVFMKETATPDDRSVWQLNLVHHNKAINRSCYIEYAYSNMVLDVPKASDKPGTAICQYPCNNRFNQRWNLIKPSPSSPYFQIQNLKTLMNLDIKGQSKKPGTPIIQWKSTGQANQLWKLEYQGKNIYLIRSAMDGNLLLCVKDNSLKECADIVTTADDSECFWRIVGYIPE